VKSSPARLRRRSIIAAAAPRLGSPAPSWPARAASQAPGNGLLGPLGLGYHACPGYSQSPGYTSRTRLRPSTNRDTPGQAPPRTRPTRPRLRLTPAGRRAGRVSGKRGREQDKPHEPVETRVDASATYPPRSDFQSSGTPLTKPPLGRTMSLGCVLMPPHELAARIGSADRGDCLVADALVRPVSAQRDSLRGKGLAPVPTSQTAPSRHCDRSA
jgi:hypothetical protein